MFLGISRITNRSDGRLLKAFQEGTRRGLGGRPAVYGDFGGAASCRATRDAPVFGSK